MNTLETANVALPVSPPPMDGEGTCPRGIVLQRFSSNLSSGWVADSSEAGPCRRGTAAFLVQQRSPHSSRDLVVSLDPSATCSSPSLNLQTGQEEGNPQVSRSGSGVQPSTNCSSVPIPAMVASVLNLADATTRVASAKAADNSSSRSNGTLNIDLEVSAQHLEFAKEFTRDTVSEAPGALRSNFQKSMTTLVQTRVRAWTLLLLRQSLSSNDDASRQRYLSLLQASSSWHVAATDLQFRALSFQNPQQADPCIDEEDSEKEADMILPLLLEATLDVGIKGHEMTVCIRAAGTISANFASSATPIMTMVKMHLDTRALMASMVEKARLVVFKAVSLATTVTSAASTACTPTGTVHNDSNKSAKLNETQSINRLRDSNNISSTLLFQAEQIRNSTPSGSQVTHLSSVVHSLRLSHQKSQQDQLSEHNHDTVMTDVLPSEVSTSGQRKRSVKWSLETVSESAIGKTKSFYVGSTGSSIKNSTPQTTTAGGAMEMERVTQGNATFSDFGRSHKTPQAPAFYNGRLHVPRRNALGALTLSGAGSMVTNKSNATFQGFEQAAPSGTRKRIVSELTRNGVYAMDPPASLQSKRSLNNFSTARVERALI